MEVIADAESERARAAAEPVAFPPAPTLRVLSSLETLRFHRLADGSVLLTRGLAIARIEGAELRWDATFSRGLPIRWSWDLDLEISTVGGADLNHAWLALRAGCGSAPSVGNTPVSPEFVRQGSLWSHTPNGERHLWRGDTCHSYPAHPFVFQGRQLLLWHTQNQATWADGAVPDEELEDLRHCLGQALVTDPSGADAPLPVLPRDLCVLNIHGYGDHLSVLGWQPSGALVVATVGAEGAPPSPALPSGCRLARTDYTLAEGGDGTFEYRGRTICDEHASIDAERLEAVWRYADGRWWDVSRIERSKRDAELARAHAEAQGVKGYVASGALFVREGSGWSKVSLPELSDADQDALAAGDREPYAEAVLESRGVLWVLASVGAANCMSYQGEVPRLLYSFAPGSRDDGVGLEDELELRLMQGDDCPGLPVRIFARATSDHLLSDTKVVAMARAVPPACRLVEIAAKPERLLGVVQAESDECRGFRGPPSAYTLCVGSQMVQLPDDEDAEDCLVVERRPFTYR